jgi:hypothetical protein
MHSFIIKTEEKEQLNQLMRHLYSIFLSQILTSGQTSTSELQQEEHISDPWSKTGL